jgi:hypothetical protein
MDRYIAQLRLPPHAHLRTEPTRSPERRTYQSVGSPAGGLKVAWVVCERERRGGADGACSATASGDGGGSEKGQIVG